jgi:23S rRNA pseudouridine1911/1915/1917 synthase
LDRPVAGVVLFARTSKAASRLSRQFRERTVEKQYLAVVQGALPKESDRLENFMERRHPVSRVVNGLTGESQKAILHYRVIERDETRSLVQITLETGRRHQIRVQMAHIGHPLLGDLRYGAGQPLSMGQIALLARELSVDHPTLGTRLNLISPVPLTWPWPDSESTVKNRTPWVWQSFRKTCEKV